jgi:integrase
VLEAVEEGQKEEVEMAVYKRKKNWCISYYIQGRRVRKTIGPSKKLAETALQKIKVQIAEGKYLDIQRVKSIKFEELCSKYLNIYSKPNKRSYDRDVQLVNKLSRFFSGRRLNDINAFMVEEYKKERLLEVSPATVNREVACCKAMFNKAVEWGLIKDSPVKTVKLLREKNTRTRFLEKEEIIRLVDNCSKHLRPVVIVAVGTGMRKGEILGLKWSDIDFNNNIIYLLDTKNGERRNVPLSKWCRAALIKIRKHPESPYVFCHKDGKPFINMRKSFKSALDGAGISDFRFHDLRHTFASQLIKLGFDVRTVQELMGHKSMDMVMRYTHLSPNQKSRAVECFGSQIDTNWAQSSIEQESTSEEDFYSIVNKEFTSCPASSVRKSTGFLNRVS